MQRSRTHISRWLLPLLLVCGFAATVPAVASAKSGKSTTGTWVTRVAAPFVYIDPDGYEPGVAAPLKEVTWMRWELTEDEDGLILGYNTYYSRDSEGGNESRGTLCMVGARQGKRIAFSEAYAIYEGEPVPDFSTVPIFQFSCEQKGKKKLQCLGSGLSNLQPTALQAVLERSKGQGNLPPVPEAAREICQPGS